MSMKRQHTLTQLLAISGVIVTSACGEQPSAPTAPRSAASPNASRPDVLADAAAIKPDRSSVVTISSLAINPTSLTIGGGSVQGTQATWTATIENPKKQSLSNVYVQTYFAVYNADGSLNARKAAGGALIQCPGRSFGFLPSGSCTISGNATPSNDASGGSGFLVPDDNTHDARFELELRQDAGGPTLKLLTKRAADVTLFYQLS